MCKNHDEADNWIEPQPTVVQKAAHGTLSAVGRSANDIPPLPADSELSNNIQRFHYDEPLPREIYDPTINQIEPVTAYTGWWIILIAIATSCGIILGIFLTKKCSKNEDFATNPLSHRNQLNWHGGSKAFLPPPRTGLAGKDVNLQMNANTFNPALCNNKKDNLELELDSKDRNHECKNSTESLEKEIPYKTGTLQKVKKTYI